MTDKPEDKPSTAPNRNSVGYGRPPIQRRFKESGNLQGRPNGAKNRETIVKTVANEVHTIIEDGKRTRRTMAKRRRRAIDSRRLGTEAGPAYTEPGRDFERVAETYCSRKT